MQSKMVDIKCAGILSQSSSSKEQRFLFLMQTCLDAMLLEREHRQCAHGRRRSDQRVFQRGRTGSCSLACLRDADSLFSPSNARRLAHPPVFLPCRYPCRCFDTSLHLFLNELLATPWLANGVLSHVPEHHRRRSAVHGASRYQHNVRRLRCICSELHRH